MKNTTTLNATSYEIEGTEFTGYGTNEIGQCSDWTKVKIFAAWNFH
jgi:hypothetical protein